MEFSNCQYCYFGKSSLDKKENQLSIQ